MSIKHEPGKGDKVHDYRRVPHANGVISGFVYEAGEGIVEVIVRFDDGPVYYDVTDFDYNWTDKYGGTYILDKEP